MSSPTNGAVLHRRQFMIGPVDLRVPLGWLQNDLGAGLVLYRHPDAAVSSDDGVTTIGLRVAGATGRFVTVAAGSVASDPAATHGLYVADSSQGPVIGTSAPLVAAAASLNRVARELDWYSFNWHVAPGSGYRGLRRLLPGQSVDAVTGRITGGRPIRPFGGDVPERADVVAARLISAITQLSNDGHLRVALTAGLDSRTLFAACLAAGVEFSTYTIEPPRAADQVDLSVARRLSSLASIEHRSIALNPVERSLARDLDRHTGRESRDADRYLASRGAYAGFTPDDVMVRGGVFEVGRRFFDQTLGHLDREAVEARPARILERVQLGPLAKRTARPSLEAWAQQRLGAHESPIISWIDQFYLDQRVGAWLASNEQLLDSLPARSVHPASDADVLTCLVVAEGEPPVGREVQRMVIERCAPELSDVPLNPAQTTSRRDGLSDRVRSVARLVRSEARTAVRYGTGLHMSKSS